MTARYRRLILGFILLFGLCARIATFKNPLLDHHSWRQADTASIARNFYRERFNILYPQVDWRGANAVGYVESGVELFAFMVAVVARATGFFPEIGRLLNALLFVASASLVWRFVGHRYGDEWGIVAAFFYAFGFPLSLYIERAFMSEALLICLSLVALCAAQHYLRNPDRSSIAAIVLLLCSSALVGVVKLPYLIIWAPIVGLFLERYRHNVWRCWELWAMAVVGLFVAALWYRHAHGLGEATGLSFGLLDKTFDARLVFSTAFASKMSVRLMKDVLEPVGFAGVVAGVWFSLRRQRWCEALGFGGFLAYVVLVARGNYVHDYYQLAIMPIAPALVILSLTEFDGYLGRTVRFRSYRVEILACALGLAALSTFVRSVSFHSWYEYSADDLQLCRSVDTFARPDERVVFIGDNDPTLLSCMDRKGWLLSPAESDEKHVRASWHAGATVAVVRGVPADDVSRFLADIGSRVFAAGRSQVFRLR